MKLKEKADGLKLKTKIICLVVLVVMTSLLFSDWMIALNMERSMTREMTSKAEVVSAMLAQAEWVRDGLEGARPLENMQILAEKNRVASRVEYIVIIDMNGIRKTHPDRSKIGFRFIGGDDARVYNGKTYTSVAEGTLGGAVRAFTPVYNASGKQIGAVVVGILLSDVAVALARIRSFIYLGVLLGLTIGVTGAVLLASRIKNTLLGLEPNEIKQLVQERSAMLESVHEGILAVDMDLKITLVNEVARELFARAGLEHFEIGQDVERCVPNTNFRQVLQTGTPELDQVQSINNVHILTNRVPVYVNGKITGGIATFRDKTELKQLAEQLTGTKQYVEALRAQTHEFMNKLHVILGMVYLSDYDKLEAYISDIQSDYQAEVGYVTKHVKHAVLAGFLLGKMSRARELGAQILFAQDAFLAEDIGREVGNELVTILGNLIDNALEAITESYAKRIQVGFNEEDEGWLTLEVSDQGKGISDSQQEQIFEKGFSTKGNSRGYGLYNVKRSVESLGGSLEVYSIIDKGTTFVVKIPMHKELSHD